MTLVHLLFLSALLFAIGLAGVIIRRTLVVVLMCLELMLTGANIALVAFSQVQKQFDAQVMTLFVMAVAAAEVAVGLALIVAMFRTRRSIDSTSLNSLKDL